MSLRERFARRRIRQRRRLVVKQLTYSNPYYPTTERQEQRFRWRRAKTVILGVVGLVAVYGLFFSPWLYIKGVTVDGNRRVAGETVSGAVEGYLRQSAWLVFKRGHRLWFRSSGLEKRLQTEIGQVLSGRQVTTITYWMNQECSPASRKRSKRFRLISR